MNIYVYADWQGLPQTILVGTLSVERTRGHEVFSFAYDNDWLTSPYCRQIDPELQLYEGPQYSKRNFRVFLDSSPDRWGRLLMKRREAIKARLEHRKEQALHEADYLLGVHDSYRLGGLRFKLDTKGPFLDHDDELAAPPMAKLRELEYAAKVVEDNKHIPSDEYLAEYQKWLNMLIAPGSSLGGARPKACVTDGDALWLAKFPSKQDEFDIGAWEYAAAMMASDSGIDMAESQIKRFHNEYHTFLSKRFDRDGNDRIHFTSAMTQLGYYDGEADAGGGLFQSGASVDHHHASYLELATFLNKYGASPDADLAQLWRRIVFSILISNTDDHLRNHGFLLLEDGWHLSPAFDINPNPQGTGLSLAISETSNALDLRVAIEQAPQFRLSEQEALEIIEQISSVTLRYQDYAEKTGIARQEVQAMGNAFMSQESIDEQLAEIHPSGASGMSL